MVEKIKKSRGFSLLPVLLRDFRAWLAWLGEMRGNGWEKNGRRRVFLKLDRELYEVVTRIISHGVIPLRLLKVLGR